MIILRRLLRKRKFDLFEDDDDVEDVDEDEDFGIAPIEEDGCHMLFFSGMVVLPG